MILTVFHNCHDSLRRMSKFRGRLNLPLIVNLLLDTNYMFLMEAEKGNPLIYFEEWFGSHLTGFPVLITLILLIMYLPHVLLHRRKKKA